MSPAPTVTTREERLAARRRRSRRSMAVAAVSTVVVLGALAAVVLTSPGWPTVRRTFFSSSEFSNVFSGVLSGFWLDVRMFMITEVIVLAVGLVIAVVRTTRVPALFPLRMLAVVWTDLFRGVPTIIVVYIVGFGVPALHLSGVPTSPVVLGCAALTMCYSAYVSEVFRAGIDSVHPSQAAAALALGLTRGQTMRLVIVPQAVRRVLPPLLNDFIALQKDVALISFLGPQEAFRAAQIFNAYNFNYTPLMAAALLYLCVTIPFTRYTDFLLDRARRQRGGELALGPR